MENLAENKITASPVDKQLVAVDSPPLASNETAASTDPLTSSSKKKKKKKKKATLEPELPINSPASLSVEKASSPAPPSTPPSKKKATVQPDPSPQSKLPAQSVPIPNPPPSSSKKKKTTPPDPPSSSTTPQPKPAPQLNPSPNAQASSSKKKATPQPNPPPAPPNPPKKAKQVVQPKAPAISVAAQSTIDVTKAALAKVTVACHAAEERATTFENEVTTHKATIAQLQKQLSNPAKKSADTSDTQAKLAAALKEISGLKTHLQKEQTKASQSAEAITRMQASHAVEIAMLRRKLGDAVALSETSSSKVLSLEAKLAKMNIKLAKKEKWQELNGGLLDKNDGGLPLYPVGGVPEEAQDYGIYLQ